LASAQKKYSSEERFKELAVPRTYYETVRSNTFVLKEKIYIRSGKFVNRFYPITKRPHTKKIPDLVLKVW